MAMAQVYSCQIRFPGKSAFRYGFLNALDLYHALPVPRLLRVRPTSDDEGFESDAERLKQYFAVGLKSVGAIEK